MSLTLADLRPADAWQRFEPSAEQPFSRRLAAHLYRRAGLAASSRELDEAVRLGPEDAVKRLLSPGEATVKFDQEMHQFAQVTLAANNPELLAGWWLHRMRHTPAPLVEKMTLFWHGHFATSATKVRQPELMLQQNELFRRHALGDFGQLVRGIARDPAMLLYLDSATNRKVHPNENFSREVMELFCLGLGRYTERDIQELARCFTGWEIQHGQFKFNPYQHDERSKTVLARSGNFDGDDGLAVILDEPATAEFICGKLLRFFVADDDVFTPEWIAPLATKFRESKLTLAPVLEMIFTSRLFYSEAALGRKVRSPIELGVGMLRALDATTNMVQLANRLRELGQMPLYPPNVKGWDGGRSWINSSTLLGRANLVRYLVENADTRFAGGPLAQLLDKQAVKSAADAVDHLAELLLAVPLAADVRAQLVASLQQGGTLRPERLGQMLHLAGTLPEFQLA
ncbi:MAG: DUF1800 domain-containing protein [Planctomycetaceae bacterium]|nr:DUF1800 domain-containing protein [Planctomycetaceae bacterium]